MRLIVSREQERRGDRFCASTSCGLAVTMHSVCGCSILLRLCDISSSAGHSARRLHLRHCYLVQNAGSRIPGAQASWVAMLRNTRTVGRGNSPGEQHIAVGLHPRVAQRLLQMRQGWSNDQLSVEVLSS
ncbi:hypothetical protein EJ03DRAFT_222408 [Teratosphaeria nubilosa]|uniref:Uncharacterized protein n=1 Tax=Teratosphaeria nubilosa TaxID=161662 RepID=A0A6G1KX84_9PEZI|nr:hypothetical protein EJ03DRAFT_222408 [Teratosphaeria nubilosa]